MNERDLERSEARVEQERDQAAIAVRAALTRPGRADCAGCGKLISEARRAAAPFADRCIACQMRFEREHAR